MRTAKTIPRAVLAIPAILALWLPLGAADAAAGPRAEYYLRLASTPPRSAAAFVELAEWCKSAGLEAEAVQSYRQAIEIDVDCEKARAALGYKRYGTGWRLPGGPPEALSRGLPPRSRAEKGDPEPAAKPPARPEKEPGAVKLSPGGPEPATAPAVAPGAEPAPPESEAGGRGLAPSGGKEGGAQGAPEEPTARPAAEKKTRPETPVPEASAGAPSFAAEIEKKRAWAKAAAAKLSVTFSTAEDNDFMIHSSLPAGSREVKALQSHLRSLKKILGGIIGSGSATKVWPDKLQLVLLKSEPEYERFAEFADGIKAAKNPDGAYTNGDHTVLWIPDSEALARLVGKTSLLELNGSTRWVPAWLETGVAELVHAQSPGGVKSEHYSRSFRLAADAIQAEGENMKIFNVIESRETRRKDEERNEALALSLVDFLLRQSRKGFHDFVKAVKSEKAPAPPGSDADSGAFHLGFISFQEEALRKSFGGAALNVLGDKWKAYVLSVTEGLKAREEEKEKEKARDSQPKKGKKGKKKEG